jgi:PKHD-type hydroxylase
VILCIADVLTPEEQASIHRSLDGVALVDGATTAGWHARTVKQNLQVDPRHPEAAGLQSLVLGALARHVLFQLAARPRIVRPILFNRYEPGMRYGTHVDDALMGDPPVRSDLSLTLFLSDPASYDGGELIVESTAGDQAFRLPPGSLVLYPSSSLHRVEPVTRGVRRAAVGWVQSLVRDPARRELLFDLDTARRSLFDREGATREFGLLSKTVANLLRMWAEP